MSEQPPSQSGFLGLRGGDGMCHALQQGLCLGCGFGCGEECMGECCSDLCS